MIKFRTKIAIILILTLQVIPSLTFAKTSFFEERYRGWLWFDEPRAKIEETKKQTNVPTAKEAHNSIEARKAALDNARNVMIETAYRPNVTKMEFLKAVEDYRNLEQAMQFMALKVGVAWDETNLLNPEYLDELNNPTNIYGRKKKEELDQQSNNAILKNLARKSEIFIFRRDDCGYCHDLEKHLDRFAKRYGFKVEAVSPDNSDSSYFHTTHSQELITALDLEVVPTVFLVADDDNHRYEIARGLVSIEQLEQATLQAAKLLKQGISNKKPKTRGAS